MKRIIAALDFSNATPVVLEAAARLARAFGADLHLLHVLEPEPTYTAYGFTPDEFPAIHTFQEEARKRAHTKLQEAAASLADCPATTVELAEGSPLQALHDYARQVDADLLIVGSHGHSLVASLLLGSVAEGIVRRAVIPVLVIPVPGKR